ncbi:MAG: HD domain-containing protein [Candidatus Puniceispirillales bacterium]|jgi:phosphonate degradation associated HDIG domain protein|tara:strand:- start:8527 stop:9096 length:570 start_codon:yes stop_codon:yes gene_type:complete
MLSNELTKENIIPFIKDIFDRRGSEEYLGENVTIAEHMLQAATLAEKKGYSETIIVAALLHDIGHFTSEFGSFEMNDKIDRFHEDAGAKILEKFFPTLVTDCVKFHVAAKRYLCATDASYYNKLSNASIHSLKLQGGLMSDEEVSKFQKNKNLNDIIKVRYLDDEGKIQNMETPDFDYFIPIIKKVLKA